MPHNVSARVWRIAFPDPAEQGVDDVSRQAMQLETELSKFQSTTPEAADVMVRLAELYPSARFVVPLVTRETRERFEMALIYALNRSSICQESLGVAVFDRFVSIGQIPRGARNSTSEVDRTSATSDFND